MSYRKERTRLGIEPRFAVVNTAIIELVGTLLASVEINFLNGLAEGGYPIEFGRFAINMRTFVSFYHEASGTTTRGINETAGPCWQRRADEPE